MNSLTLQSLINELNNLIQNGVDPETPIHISYPYGDYWNTQVAPSINYVEEGKVKYSSYHNMDKIDENDEEDSKLVIILSQ